MTTQHAIYPSLRGKNVLITGGAEGIGAAAVELFAKQGSQVIILDISQSSAETLISKIASLPPSPNGPIPTPIFHQSDVSDLPHLQNLAQKILQEHKIIHILINNAAAMEPAQRLLDSDPETYWRTWEVNVRGLMNMSRTFLPSLLSSPTKTMLNLSSSGALAARPAGASYRCSKLAILRWTESLQLEYGGEGLLTYCVNPGSVRTELSRGIGEQARAGLRDEPGMAGDTIVWLAAQRKEWLGGRYVSCAWDMEELVGMEGEIVRGDKLKLRMVF